MEIGIVAAMEVEAKILIEKLELKKIDILNNVYGNSNINKYSNIVLVIAGIGMENSAIATQHLILKYNIKNILNFGYVGSNKLKIGTIVSPNKVYNKDFDLTIMGYEKYKIPGVEDLELNLINEYNSCVCYSANHFVIESTEEDPVIYDMELHGIAIVCRKLNMPVSSIKIVTDTLDADKYNESESDISFSEILSEAVIKYIGN